MTLETRFCSQSALVSRPFFTPGLVRWILAQPAGNARIRRSPPPFRPARRRNLTRQYSTIALVGWSCSWSSIGAELVQPRRFRGGRAAVGTRGHIGMFNLGARNVRTAQAAPWRASTPRSRSRPCGAITGMLVVAWGCSSGRILPEPCSHLLGDSGGGAGVAGGSPSAVRSSRSSRLGGGIFTKARTSAPTSSARSRPGYGDAPRNPAVIATRGRQRGRLRRHGRRLFETYAVTLVATMLPGAW